jgi:hypothetical protein
MEYGSLKRPCKMQCHYSDKSHARTILRMNCGVQECALRNELINMRSCAAADDCTKLVTAYIYLGCARSFHQASASPHRFALLSFLEICFHLRTSVSTSKWDSYKFKNSETAITNYCCKKKNSSKYFWNLYRSSITTRSMPALIIMTSITQQK